VERTLRSGRKEALLEGTHDPRDAGRGETYRDDMEESPSGRLTVELTHAEARLVVAALRQFEPYWPSDIDDMSRAELLAGIRQGIAHVRTVLDPAAEPTPQTPAPDS
jgi:hypothetical protein